MQIMEGEHNFFATVRMYKARFQQWGIEKKIKAEDAVEIFRQQTARAKKGKETVAYVRGRKINPDRLQRYRYRAAAVVSEQILMAENELNAALSESAPVTSHVICRTPSPSPSPTPSPPSLCPSPDDPLDFKIPLDCIAILKSYLAGASESGAWQVADPGVNRQFEAFTWAHYLATSQGLIVHNRTKEGFFLLGICFEQYKLHILNPDSFFWLATYKAALLLAHRDQELADAFMRYASSLTAVLLPRSHPFNQIWSKIMITGLAGLQKYAAVLFESYLDAWKQHAAVPCEDPNALAQWVFVVIQLHSSGMVSYRFTKETIEQTLDQIGNSNICQYLLQEAKFRMACLLVETNRFDEAEAIITEITAWLDLQSRTEHVHLRCKCLWVLFELMEKKESTSQAIQAGYSLVKFCHDVYGPVHLQTVDAFSAVESYHRRIDNNAAWQKMSEQFDKRWLVLHDLARANNGFPHDVEEPWLHRCIELAEEQHLIQEVIDLTVTHIEPPKHVPSNYMITCTESIRLPTNTPGDLMLLTASTDQLNYLA
ncbi:hypothetical protein F5Y18DRAFT_429239 [Xylariaceae sp. FL1019]|nr:hypothetical protein F5Y18DRAFT_429239 [Xylariaceae sp. FL1019]